MIGEVILLDIYRFGEVEKYGIRDEFGFKPCNLCGVIIVHMRMLYIRIYINFFNVCNDSIVT